MSDQPYDNTLPLFLGGSFRGQIRLVQDRPELLKYPGEDGSEPLVYQRWTLAAGGREWVFYRVIGMTDADALAALVSLAAKEAGSWLLDGGQLATAVAVSPT